MGESHISSWQGMALALRSIALTDGLGDMEDEPRRGFGERGLSGWDKKIFRSLEKVAKEVGVEHISAGMSIRAL